MITTNLYLRISEPVALPPSFKTLFFVAILYLSILVEEGSRLIATARPESILVPSLPGGRPSLDRSRSLKVSTAGPGWFL
ncbi:hypothetical protein BDR03DRAFT_966977, partial [Suillus americanus]